MAQQPQKQNVEFELEDGTILELPEDVTDDELQQQVDAIHRERRLAVPAAQRLGQGVASTLLPTDRLSDVWEGPKRVLQHPLDSLQLLGGALKDAYVGQGKKAIDEFKSGKTGQGAARAMALTIPIPGVGPAVGNVMDSALEGDLAGALGQALGLGASAAVGREIDAPRAARRFQRSATERFTKFTAPTSGPNARRLQGVAERAAPEYLRDPRMKATTREELALSNEDAFHQATDALDAASNAVNPKKVYPIKPMVKALDAAIQRLTAKTARVGNVKAGSDVQPRPNLAEIETLTAIRDELQTLGKDSPFAPYESIRRVREAWDRVARPQYYKDTPADLLKTAGNPAGAEKGTGIMRDYLAKQEPSVAKANADYSLHKGMNDVLKAARSIDRKPGLLRMLAGRWGGAVAMGAAGGGADAIIGFLAGQAVENALSSGYSTKLMTARGLQRLADALRGGNAGQVNAALKAIGAGTLSANAIRSTTDEPRP